MAKNIYQITKDLVEKQTKDRTNVKISDSKITSFKSQNLKQVESRVGLSAIMWFTSSYSWDRGFEFPIDRDTYNNYYREGSYKSFIIDNKGISLVSPVSNTNLRIATRVYSVTNRNITLSFECGIGNFGFFIQKDGGSIQTVVDSNGVRSSGSFTFSLDANSWYTIEIFYYKQGTGGYVKLSDGLRFYIDNNQEADIVPPNIPTWSIPTIQTSLVDPKTGAAKVDLYWKKNSEPNFSGNGIYRTSLTSISGVSVHTKLDSSIAFNSFAVASSQLGTIRAGAQISVSGNATLLTVKNVRYVKANQVTDGIFTNKFTNWAKSLNNPGNFPTIVKHTWIFGTHSVKLFYKGTATKSFITSADYIAVSTSKSYIVSWKSANNALENFDFRYPSTLGNTPSMWNFVQGGSGASGVLSTLDGINFRALKVIKGTSNQWVYVRSNGFYVGTNQNVIVGVYGKCLGTEGANFVIERIGDGSASYGAIPASGLWKLGTISNYFTAGTKIRVLLGFRASTGTTGDICYFRDPYLINSHKTTSSFLMRLSFFKSDNSACATPNFKSPLGTTFSWGQKSIGINKSKESGVFKFPLTCAKIKLTAEIGNNDVSSIQSIYEYISGLSVKEGTSFDLYNPATVGLTYVETVATLNPAITGGVSQYKFVHLLDRLVQPTDTGTINWTDLNVSNGTKYIYVIDAFDKSMSRNRSGYSSVASIIAGDVFPPAGVINLTSSSDTYSIKLNWINPSNTDLAYVKIYANPTCTANRLIIDLPAKPNASMEQRFHYFNDEIESKGYWLTTVDKSYNESKYVPATKVDLARGPANTYIVDYSANYKTNQWKNYQVHFYKVSSGKDSWGLVASNAATLITTTITNIVTNGTYEIYPPNATLSIKNKQIWNENTTAYWDCDYTLESNPPNIYRADGYPPGTTFFSGFNQTGATLCMTMRKEGRFAGGWAVDPKTKNYFQNSNFSSLNLGISEYDAPSNWSTLNINSGVGQLSRSNSILYFGKYSGKITKSNSVGTFKVYQAISTGVAGNVNTYAITSGYIWSDLPNQAVKLYQTWTDKAFHYQLASIKVNVTLNLGWNRYQIASKPDDPWGTIETGIIVKNGISTIYLSGFQTEYFVNSGGNNKRWATSYYDAGVRQEGDLSITDVRTFAPFSEGSAFFRFKPQYNISTLTATMFMFGVGRSSYTSVLMPGWFLYSTKGSIKLNYVSIKEAGFTYVNATVKKGTLTRDNWTSFAVTWKDGDYIRIYQEGTLIHTSSATLQLDETSGGSWFQNKVLTYSNVGTSAWGIYDDISFSKVQRTYREILLMDRAKGREQPPTNFYSASRITSGDLNIREGNISKISIFDEANNQTIIEDGKIKYRPKTSGDTVEYDYPKRVWYASNLSVGVPTLFTSLGIRGGFLSAPKIGLYPERLSTYLPGLTTTASQQLEIYSEAVGTTGFIPRAVLWAGSTTPTIVNTTSATSRAVFVSGLSINSTLWQVSYDGVKINTSNSSNRVTVKIKTKWVGNWTGSYKVRIGTLHRYTSGTYSFARPVVASVIYQANNVKGYGSMLKEHIFTGLSSATWDVKLDFTSLYPSGSTIFPVATLAINSVIYQTFGTKKILTGGRVGAIIIEG